MTGNGILDIVAANRGFNNEGQTASVLMGNGDGSFQSPRTLQVGHGPAAVALGDFNGDGILDIVTANFTDDTVSVLLGNGDGTFQARTDYADSRFPEAVAVSDLRQDGRFDIVVANEGFDTVHGSVSVLLNNGDGTFASAQNYLIGLGAARANARSVAVGDLQGDGIPDIVSVNVEFSGGSVSVLRGNGDGTFQAAVSTTIEANPISATLADLNGTGHLDLVMAGGDQISVFFGNGDGTFGPEIGINGGQLPHSVTAADLTGTGTLDLVAANTIGEDVSVIRNNGDGTFQQVRAYGTGSHPMAVAEGDFTGNGVTDLVTANYLDDTVSVLLGNGDGTFQTAVNYAAGFHPRDVAVADLTGNGILDLVVVDSNQNHGFGPGIVSVLLGNGDGTFQAPRTSVVRAQNDIAIDLAVGDLTGRGIPDIAVIDEWLDPRRGFVVSEVSVLAGNRDGTFQELTHIESARDNQPRHVLIANFNGFNGIAYVDLLGMHVINGHGDGTFTQGADVLDGAYPVGLAAADLTGNGILDFVAADSLDGTVSVAPGNADGSFQPAVSYRLNRHADAVAVADVNGDGIPDLVTANADENSVAVFLGNGDGTFQTPVRYLVGQEPDALVVGDFNGDGSPDVAVANSVASSRPLSGDSVSVLLNQNDGTLPGRHAARGGTSERQALRASPPASRSRTGGAGILNQKPEVLSGIRVVSSLTSESQVPSAAPTPAFSQEGVVVPAPDLAVRDWFFQVSGEENSGSVLPRSMTEDGILSDPWWAATDPASNVGFESAFRVLHPLWEG